MVLSAPTLAVVLLGVLAGCDGATADPTPATIQLTTPFADIEMTVDDEGVAVQLSDHFSAGAAHLTFTAEITGGAASLDWEDQANRILRIEPASIGESTITVTARATGGITRSETFRVRVLLGRCPPPAGVDSADYFPLTVGQEWRFDYVREYRSTSSGGVTHTRNVGESTITVTSATCVDGRRRAAVRLHATGDSFHMSEYPDPPEWVFDGPFVNSDTQYFEETAENLVYFLVPDFGHLFGTQRYAPSAGPNVIVVPSTSWCSSSITLTRDAGMTGLSAACSLGGHVFGTVTMTRRL